MSTNQNFSHKKKSENLQKICWSQPQIVVLRLKTEFSYISDFEKSLRLVSFSAMWTNFEISTNFSADLFYKVNFTWKGKKLRLK